MNALCKPETQNAKYDTNPNQPLSEPNRPSLCRHDTIVNLNMNPYLSPGLSLTPPCYRIARDDGVSVELSPKRLSEVL